MSESQRAIEAFCALVAETPGVWRSVEIGCVALSYRRAFHNLVTRIRLDAREADDLAADVVLASTDSLLAVRRRVAIDQLGAVLNQLAIGVLRYGGEQVVYRSGNAQDEPESYANGYARSAAIDGKPSSRFGRAHILELTGDDPHFMLHALPRGLEHVNDELRSADEPWDGINDLIADGIGSDLRVEPGTCTRLNVIAPIGAHLHVDSSSLRDGMLTLAIEVDNPYLTEWCSIGYVVLTADGVGQRGSRDRDRLSWNHGGTAHRSLVSIRTHQEAVTASIFLRVGRFVVDRLDLTDVARRADNIRVSAYHSLDPNLEVFRQSLLSPSPKGQTDFERAVARLFTLAGFQVDSFAGDNRLSDAVDLFAFAPGTTTMLAIECTTQELQTAKGKPSRVMRRATTLRNVLADQFGARVIAVMATALPREDIPASDLVTARTNQTMVLAREDLEALASFVLDHAAAVDTLAFLQTRQLLTPVSPRSPV